MIPTKLAQLYTRSTKMAETSPEARGIEYDRWRMLQTEKQCSELLAKMPRNVEHKWMRRRESV